HPRTLRQPPARPDGRVGATEPDRRGVREPIGAVVADAGYWSQQSAAVDTGPELFIATRKRRPRAHAPLPSTGRIPASATALQRMERKLNTTRGKSIYAKRSVTVEPVFG